MVTTAEAQILEAGDLLAKVLLAEGVPAKAKAKVHDAMNLLTSALFAIDEVA